MAMPRFLKSLSYVILCTVLIVVVWETGSGSMWRSEPPPEIPQQFLADLPGCSAIVSGDVTHKVKELERLLASKTKEPLSEAFYLQLTKDCPSFIESRAFLTEPLSAEERDFPIAYSMVIHDQIEMFERLLRSIYAPHNVYCVHVDNKSESKFKAAVEAIVSCFPNVFIASRLENVVYASWSRVQADLNCMEDLLKSQVKWRYLLNTCGADFPIKTNREMVRMLQGLWGKNSMETEVTSSYKMQRWQYHYNVTDTIVRTSVKKSPPPISTPMFSGNAYFAVTRAFVAHVLEDPEVGKLLEWEKDTYSPDEHLWATLQRMPSVPGSLPTNTKFDVSDMHAVVRAVKWSYLAGKVILGAPYEPCTGAYRRAVCVYGSGDLRWLLEQRHLLANKFDPKVDDVAIRCLELYLRSKALEQDGLSTDTNTRSFLKDIWNLKMIK